MTCCGPTLYFCPESGDIECQSHSGHSVCCSRPEVHIPLESIRTYIRYLDPAAREPLGPPVHRTRSTTRIPVTREVLKYLRQRALLGVERYGEELHTGNGRDPLVDELEELADALLYRAQHLIERDGALPSGRGVQ